VIDHRRREDASGARGEPVAMPACRRAFDLQLLKPVYVGDTISYATEVIDRRPSAGRSGYMRRKIPAPTRTACGRLAVSSAVERRRARDT
jgi:acyl dehydratase